MDALIISQTIFYIVASIATIVVLVMFVIVVYYFIAILKNTRSISSDIANTYIKTKKNIKKIISSFNKNSKN